MAGTQENYSTGLPSATYKRLNDGLFGVPVVIEREAKKKSKAPSNTNLWRKNSQLYVMFHMEYCGKRSVLLANVVEASCGPDVFLAHAHPKDIELMPGKRNLVSRPRDVLVALMDLVAKSQAAKFWPYIKQDNMAQGGAILYYDGSQADASMTDSDEQVSFPCICSVCNMLV